MTATRLERVARFHWDQARIATITSAVRCGALVPCDPASGQWFRWQVPADLHPDAQPYGGECPDCGAPPNWPCWPSCPRYWETPDG